GAKTLFHSGDPDHGDLVGRTLAEIADERGTTPWDALVDLALAADLDLSWGNAPAEDPPEDWAARLQVWRDPRAVIGASDAGAHLDLFLSANYTTTMIGAAVNRRGLLPLEEAVHLLTRVPAQLYGLVDRGVVAEGAWADLLVLDADRV